MCSSDLLENRLFRRDTFAYFETDVIPEIVHEVMAPSLAAGVGDLLPLARKTMMMLAVDVAGVDRPSGTQAEIDRLYLLMDRLARASTVGHATGDKDRIVADGDAALDDFEREFFLPSLQRRRTMLELFEAGTIGEAELPRDVLTTLLRNQDRLDLPYSTLLREVAYFPWVGSHSTSHQFVHAMHHIFDWLDEPDPPHTHVDRVALLDDPLVLQRFVHESLRLHPASPVALRRALADVVLRSGAVVPSGEMLSISVHAANRDAAVFGTDADRFNPFRTLPDGVPPWGLSFGHGLHACLGQELAGGLEPAPSELDHHLLGSIAVMAAAALTAGVRRLPDQPPVLDTSTTRTVFATYPVAFG